ncbi:ABC transporter permease [Streptosporangium sp. NPDC049644]|uniref:ABC transporter permease n=1 Tax=Streptosporangium sp. NPDC049644 TaxID=3155507 RepID=UPI0034184F83
MTTETVVPESASKRASGPARPAQDREQRRERLLDLAKLWGIRIAIVVVFCSAWQFASGRLLPVFIISSPTTVVERFGQFMEGGKLLSHLSYTMQACGLGFAIGALVGSTLGLLFGIYESTSRVIAPFAAMLYSMPKIMLSPLIVVWVGVDLTMKVFVAAFSCMWVIFYNVWNATRRIDHNLLDQMRLMGANQRQIITGLYLPSATTWLLTSLRVAFPVALIGAVVGEFVASSQGLGHLALDSGQRYDSAGVLVAVLTITVTAMTIDSVLGAIQRKVALWQGEGARG